MPRFELLGPLSELEHITSYPAASSLKSLNSLAALATLSSIPTYARLKSIRSLGDSDVSQLAVYAGLGLAAPLDPAFRHMKALEILKFHRGSGHPNPPDPRVLSSLIALGALASLSALDPLLEGLRYFEVLAGELQLYL